MDWPALTAFLTFLLVLSAFFFYERLSLDSQTDKVAMNPDGTAEVKRGIKTDICANSFPAEHRDVT